jgi:hypothetical protein
LIDVWLVSGRAGLDALLAFSALRSAFQQLDQLRRPKAGLCSGAVASRLLTDWNEKVTRVSQALDLFVHHTRFGWIAFVIGRVDRQDRRLNFFQLWRRVVVA